MLNPHLAYDKLKFRCIIYYFNISASITRIGNILIGMADMTNHIRNRVMSSPHMRKAQAAFKTISFDYVTLSYMN